MNTNQLSLTFGIVLLSLCYYLPYLMLLAIPFIIIYFKPTAPIKSSNYNPPEEPPELKLFIFRKNKLAYLQTVFWTSKRKTILTRDKFTCQSCGITNVPLHVHHLRDYDKLGYESLDALVAVCEECHSYQHLVYGYPQTYDDYMNWNVQLIKRIRDDETTN